MSPLPLRIRIRLTVLTLATLGVCRGHSKDILMHGFVVPHNEGSVTYTHAAFRLERCGRCKAVSNVRLLKGSSPTFRIGRVSDKTKCCRSTSFHYLQAVSSQCHHIVLRAVA